MTTSPDPGDRYEDRGELGRGGMGRVLRMGDRELGRDVAMKVVSGSEDPDRLQRFINEARITGQLEHPNIVPVHELGTDAEGRHYFTMKLIEGESLEHVLDRLAAEDAAYAERYPLARLVQILLKVCDAISFAHSRGVIHRDLKPENVMVGAFGEVLVVDWGLAKARGLSHAAAPERAIEIPADAAAGLTLEGDLMGTPAYMSPEQARADHAAVDARSDVFALGALLYAMLTHHAPYAQATVFATVRAAQECRPVPPSERAPAGRVPPELASICRKAMQADPVARYEDAADLEADLTAFVEQRMVGAHTYGAGERAVRVLQRHPAGSLATAVGVVVLAVAGGVVGVITSQKEAADARAENARLEAAAAEREAELSAAREAAAAVRADAAESSLAKSRAMAAMLRRARAELGGAAIGMRRLRFAELPEAEKVREGQRLVERHAAFAASLDDTPAARAVATALEGWLRWGMGDHRGAARAFEASRAADPDSVPGWLFDAMAAMAEYMELERFPSYNLMEDRIDWHAYPSESAEQRGLRVRFEGLVAAMAERTIWGDSSSAEFERAFTAMRDWRAGKVPEAVDGWTRALAVPELGWIEADLLFMRAKARIRRHEFGPALIDLQRTMAYDLLGSSPWQYTAQAHAMQGHVERFAGRDPRPAWHNALHLYRECDRRYPRRQAVHQPMGLLEMEIARLERAEGGDAEAWLRMALDSFTQATRPPGRYAVEFNTAVAYASRVNARQLQAEWLEQGGRDALAADRAAFEDALSALAAYPNLQFRDDMLNRAVRRYCHALSRRGTPPGPVLDDRLAQLPAAAPPPNAPLEPFAKRIELLAALHRFGEVVPLRRAYFERLPARDTRGVGTIIQKEERLAAEPAWARRIVEAIRWVDLGDYGRARVRLEAALAEAPPDAKHEPVARGWLQLAQMRSLASIGQVTVRRKPGTPVPPPAEAAASRRAAVEAIRTALDRGWGDLEMIRAAQSFTPLRGMPEFQALLKK